MSATLEEAMMIPDAMLTEAHDPWYNTAGSLWFPLLFPAPATPRGQGPEKEELLKISS